MAQLLKITLAGKTYLFGEDTSDNVELIDLENVTGWDTGEIMQRLAQGSMRALTAVVWICLRRDKPGLTYPEVRFKTGDLGVELVDEEGELGNGEGRSLER